MNRFFLCALALALPLAPAAAQEPAPEPAVATVDSARETLPNDYLRVGFLPAGTPVTTLSRPGAIRAFVTATPLFEPPLKLKDLPAYSGLTNNDGADLVAMRCRPQHPEVVDAVLATWPGVFAVLQHDLKLDPALCAATPADPAAQAFCYALGFADPAATSVPAALKQTLDYAAVLFDPAHAPVAKWLKDNYGIFPAFSGLGYSVKDSYFLDTQPMNAQAILVKSVSSEYILKNLPLGEAGCRCIRVAAYEGRASDPLDPEFIAQAGGEGSCAAVKRLLPGKKH